MTKKYLGIAVVAACALALVSGCKKKAATDVPTAKIAEAAAPAVAPTAAALQIVQGKPLKKGIDAMPELADASTPTAQKINAVMKNSDAQALSNLKDCKSYTCLLYTSSWEHKAFPRRPPSSSYSCGR